MYTLRVVIWSLAAIFVGSFSRAQSKKGSPMIKKLTPVLFVDRIEPCVDFWVDRMGFQKTVEVPEGDRLGFVILVKDGVELIYQSKASLEKDLPQVAAIDTPSVSYLYVEVADLQSIETTLRGIKYFIPKRTTFYGATEVLVRDPVGNFFCFAQAAGQPSGHANP